MEAEVLRRIITLDIVKIWYYLKEISALKDLFEAPISTIKNRVNELLQLRPYLNSFALHRFLEWLRQIFVIQDLPLESESKDLMPYIRWA